MSEDQCPYEWDSEDIPHIEYNEFTVFDLDNEKQAQDLNEFHWQPVAKEKQNTNILINKLKNNGR